MRRSGWCAALVVATVALAICAPRADALPSPCDVVGIPFVPDPAEKACDKVIGVTGGVAGDIAGDAAKAVAQPIFRQATEWVAQGAGWLVARIGALIDTTTTPRLETRWFAGQYEQMTLLATALALPLLFLAVIQAAIAQNAQVITRALAAIPVAFVLTGAAVAIVAALLQVTDWACQAISGHVGADSREFFHDVARAFDTITDNGGPAGTAPALFVALLASIFAGLAALAVWIELLIRSAGIYVCVLFFPVVLVARIWPKLEKWATRVAEALTALVLSKFVVVAVLSVAAGAIANSRASEGFNGVLAAGALLVFAAFAPLVLFRLVQFADPQVHARAGSAGTVARTGQTTLTAAQSARIAMDRQSASPAASGGGAAQMARTTAAAGNFEAGGSTRSGGGAASVGGSPPNTGGAESISVRSTGGTPTVTGARGAAPEPGGRAATAGAGTSNDAARGQPAPSPSDRATGSHTAPRDRRPLESPPPPTPPPSKRDGGQGQ